MLQKKYIYLSYLLVLVGYMTLTLSLPLVGNHLTAISTVNFQYGLSILFFMFSISAISLSRVADFTGAYRVLRIAQPISIIGLIVVAMAPNHYVFYLGFFLMGAGTGCYSSIARLLIAKHASDSRMMRKFFSNFSIILMIAPLVSSHIMLWNMPSYWRFAYFIMAGVEVLLILYVWFCLSRVSVERSPIRIGAIFKGYHYCLAKPYYLANLFFVGMSVAIVINVFMANAHELFVSQLHFSLTMFSWLILGLTVAYVLGIFSLRFIPDRFSIEKMRMIAVALLALALLVCYLGASLFAILFTIYLACYALGFLCPLSTSAGLTVIKENHGAAAALYTFSFAIFSSFWSLIKSVFSLTVHSEILISLLVVVLVMLVLYFTLLRRQQG